MVEQVSEIIQRKTSSGPTLFTCVLIQELKQNIIVDPPFCPPSTCPIRYLFHTLQQFLGGPLLLM